MQGRRTVPVLLCPCIHIALSSGQVLPSTAWGFSGTLMTQTLHQHTRSCLKALVRTCKKPSVGTLLSLQSDQAVALQEYKTGSRLARADAASLGRSLGSHAHQISNLTVVPSGRCTEWLMKAAPTVTLLLASNWPLTYRSTRQDFPTPCSHREA